MSLAIAEKRQHHHRGCAGVFFQLWEWNRRLARRKLFFKRLLPPGRPAKKASEVFGIDDKMPPIKLLLIAEESRGGFPDAEKLEPDAGPGGGKGAPGLVARLMGLESMPVSAPEMADEAMVESRPPKLQKTGEGLLERRTTEEDGEQTAPPGNNGAMKSRAGNRHQKLASPAATSPRLLAGRPRARLMQAATKILEPRVQSRNGARSLSGYVESSMADADANLDAIATEKSEELLDGSISKSSVKFDGFVGKSQSGMHKKETFSSGDGSSCSSVSKISNRMRPCPQAGVALPSKPNEFRERRRLVGNNQTLSRHRLHSASLNNLKQTQAAAVRDKVAFGSKKLIIKDKNEPSARRSPVSTARALNNHNGIGLTCGVTDMQKVNMARISWEKKLAHKRATSGSHDELFPAVESALVKEDSTESCSINSKAQLFTDHQDMNKKSIRNELRKKVNGDCSSGTAKAIAPLAFSSSIKHSTRPFLCEAMTERARDTHEPHQDVSLKRPPAEMKNNNMPLKRRIRSAVDEQSTVLGKKTGEVTSDSWNELRTRKTLTAASILQELIAALIAGDPVPGQNGTNAGCSPQTITSGSHSQDLFNFSVLRSQMINVKKDCQKESKLGSTSAFLHTKNDHPSPISILEASFSNDSCSYKSLDASSEGKLADSWSTSESSVMDPDSDILDSATSVDISKSDHKMFSYSSISHCRISVHSCEVGQPKYKPHAAAQAVSNASTLLENFILTGSDGIKEEFSLEHFLQDTLGVILDSIRLQRTCSYKEGAAHMFRQCLFDCIIQCLDSKYKFLFRSGYKNWSKLSPFLTLEKLRREIHEQIRGWVDMDGKFSAELIENEMDNSTGRWTDCGDEAFEAGKEIARDILEALVSDMILDFRLSFMRKYKSF